MAHSIEVVSPVSRKISVTIPAEEVNAAIGAAAREVGASVTLPGFRKGKAPASVIEKRFPEEVISRAQETLVQDRLSAILKEEHLEPLPPVTRDNAQPVRGQDFSYTVSFEILPEDVKLPEDLSTLAVEVASADATEEDINAATQNLLKSLATYEDVTENRLPEDSDILTVDIEGTVEGKPVSWLQAKNSHIRLAAPNEEAPVPELDTILRGLHVGEEASGSAVASDHLDESIRGKTIDLHVKLHKISREILPVLDDAFASAHGFENADAIRKMLAERVAMEKRHNVHLEAEGKLVDSLLEGQDFPLPERIVKQHMYEYEAEIRNYLEHQGLEKDPLDELVKNMTAEIDAQAKKRARRQVLLTTLARRENLKVSEQEVAVEILNVARRYQQDSSKPLTQQESRNILSQAYQNGFAEHIRENMLVQKAMDLLFDKARKTAPVEAAAE